VPEKTASSRRPRGWALGLAFGVAIGTALGAATENIGTWLPIWIGLGLIFGMGWDRRRKRDEASRVG